MVSERSTVDSILFFVFSIPSAVVPSLWRRPPSRTGVTYSRHSIGDRWCRLIVVFFFARCVCVCVQCVSSVFPEDLYLTNLRCKDVVDSASLISPTDGCRVCPPPQQWVYYLHLSQVNFDCVSCVRPEGLGSPSDMGNCTGKSNDKQNGSAFDRVTSRTSTEDDCLLYQLADYQKGMFSNVLNSHFFIVSCSYRPYLGY